MKQIFAILSIFIVFIHLNVAVRISEKKCEEYSKIPRSANSQMNTHIVGLRITTEDVIFSSTGTLISDRFVLTYGMEINNLILYRSQVIFSNGEKQDIVEKYIHPLFNGSIFNYHNLALLRIKIATLLDSSHRPACLWTNNYFESAVVKLYNKQKLLVPHESLFGSSCIDTESSDNTSLFCMVQSNAQDYEWAVVSFIVRQVEPNYAVATNISDHLDWIESIVWPTTTTTCGVIQINIKSLIAYSTPTFHGEFPWHAAIYHTKGHGDRRYICGGTLLNENTVLTAAHCVTRGTGIVSPHLIIVSLGTYDLTIANIESREINVDRVIPHEHFDRIYLANDIAILKLKTNIEFSNFIQPICITNDSSVFNSTLGVIPGWGQNEHDIAENILTKASMPILTNTECRDINRTIFPALLNDNNFCAGHLNGTALCPGDGGTGLIFQYDGRFFIRGIVSNGLRTVDFKCDTTQPTIFTDVVNFYDWITNINYIFHINPR